MTTTAQAQPLMKIRDLKKHFPIRSGFLKREIGRVKAVDGVSFDLAEGECFGLVGESGSGKTTVGRLILRALQPTSGEIQFRVDGRWHDVAGAEPALLKSLRRHMQMIFQDPYSSLNPRMTVFDLVGEPLLLHGMTNRAERVERVRELLNQVGLDPRYLQRYPHAFSGGQRQRIGIARALALNPDLIVADEAVSALDVSVQAQVLNLMRDLQVQRGLTYLFIAHDLSVVRHVSDRVGVMYVGRLVEMAEVEKIHLRPRHPYTEALLSAVPVPDPRRRNKRVFLQGETADPANPPSGCVFHPRCRYAEDRCQKEIPDWREIEPGHFIRCHLAENLEPLQSDLTRT